MREPAQNGIRLWTGCKRWKRLVALLQMGRHTNHTELIPAHHNRVAPHNQRKCNTTRKWGEGKGTEWRQGNPGAAPR